MKLRPAFYRLDSSLATAGSGALPVSCPGEPNEGEKSKGEQGERKKKSLDILENQDYDTE